MISIDDKLISDDIVEKHFICHIERCKGICCVKGDGGAPLTGEEKKILKSILEKVKPYLTEEGINTLNEKGPFIYDKEDDEFTTPLRNSDTACAYVNFEEDGTACCGIERAYEAGVIDFRKPVSCHLYPIRVKEYKDFTALNYDVWEICSDACTLGKELGVPVYKFLKDALIRRFGEEFYRDLCAAAGYVNKEYE